MKILVIRFSSIGDIVLTTPVLRALRNRFPEAEIHFLTKSGFVSLVDRHPAVNKVLTHDGNWPETERALKANGPYQKVIDLHKNLRSRRAIGKIKGSPDVFSFDKLNVEKWMAVRLKSNRLPEKHLVDRYFEGTDALGLSYDGKGLDFPETTISSERLEALGIPTAGFVVLVAGAAHATKRIPADLLMAIATHIDQPCVIVGSADDNDPAFENAGAINSCGKTSLDESAALIRMADAVVTSDTGMMHIATAFKKPMAVIWGNTIPEFGMYPFDHNKGVAHFQVEGLKCRPCSKIGYAKCPKRHFRCMRDQDPETVAAHINKIMP